MRARQTAEAIGLAAGREPFVLDELLDLDHGRWQGLTPDEAQALDPDEYQRFRRDPRSATAPGGEPMADVEARMRSAIRSLATRYPGEEARCRFGLLLERLDREPEAQALFREVVSSVKSAPRHYRSRQSEWLRVARQHLKG